MNRVACWCLAAIVALGLTCGNASIAGAADLPRLELAANADTEVSRKPGYAGLRLRQNPEGVVVGGVLPGPLGGDGFKSPSIWRGDLIVSINGQSLDAAGYVTLVRSLAAGDTVRVVYRRSAGADPYAAIPQGDPVGEERSVEVVLDEAGKWRAPIGQGLAPGRAVPPAQRGEFEDLILDRSGQLGLRTAIGGLDALTAYVASVQQNLLAPDSLPDVVQALGRPLSLDRVEAGLAAQVRSLAESQSVQRTLLALHRFILRTLDVPDMQGQPDLAARLSAAQREYGPHAQNLMKAMGEDITVLGPALPQHLQVVRAGRELAPLAVAMLPSVAQYADDLQRWAREAAAAPQPIPPEVAERVQAAVDGPVLAAMLVDGELWVVGGDQPNRYRMDSIAAVLDVGGSDAYEFSSPAPRAYQIVIDDAGDDAYESHGDFAGPATGIFSVALLWDRGGNDRYISHHQGSIAAALFGVGILVDESGDDRYIDDTQNAGWAQGVGVYGAGVLIDRAGDDLYDAQILSQGVGGPAGLGLIVDGGGNDTYIANGPNFGSAYGTPEVFAGLSQGFGVGIREIAPGGVGAIYDFAGDDFYSMGEFGQGTGYFQGLGIIHDGAGDDRYVGARYAQGSGVHQAAGILVDDAGNDSYVCAGPAAQGAAWDQSVGMLVDRGGDDSYLAEGLSQGAAAQQAIGILVDLGGRDSYSCTIACQGQGSENRYHYDQSRVFSFSAFIHRGGRDDTFTQSRPNDRMLGTGRPRPDDPGASDCCGLFLDE